MESQAQQQGMAPWVKALTMAAVVLIIATLLAPVAAVLAIPVLLILTVHHVIAMARTSGSIVPFAVLLAFDMLALIVVVGALFSHLS